MLLNALMSRLGRARSAASAGELQRQAEQAAAKGDTARAASLLEQLLERAPDHCEGRLMLGILRCRGGEHAAALPHLMQAAALGPDRPDTHLALGNLYHLLGKARAAEESYRRVIELDPQADGAHYNLAVLLRAAGRHGEAMQQYRRAHELGRPEATWDLVQELLEAGEEDAARAAADFAVGRAGESAPAQKSRGLVHLFQHEPVPALARFERATQLASGDVESWLHAGIAAQELGRFDQAMAAYETVLRLDPDYAPARWRRSLLHLLAGDFHRGWPDYEARFVDAARPARGYPQARWQGESLGGKSLLVWGEQGLGDEIMFASCFPDLIAEARSCVIECDSRLAPIFRRSFPQATVHAGDERAGVSWLASVGTLDFQIAAGSVPRHRRSRHADFPRHSGYLRADPAKVTAWRGRLDALGPGLKVGLSWRGGTRLSRSHLRSLTLEQLLPVLAVRGVRFVDLQYTDSARERADLADARGLQIVHWPTALADYDETAALVSALDLTLSVCTAVVHLAGALGRPVWVMTPYSPEWRYGHAGDSMPWYPSARLVRQRHYGEWGPVIDGVVADLRRLARA